MPGVRVARVLSEDPWKTDLLLEDSFNNAYEAFVAFDAIVRKYEDMGWKCDDYGSASTQLCVKNGEKRVISVWLDPIPEDKREGDA